MKWSEFLSSGGDYTPGDWNVIDDISGFKIKASQAVKTWDGFMTRADLALERNPQDFLRTQPEKSIPWSRPEQPDVFTNGTNDDV